MKYRALAISAALIISAAVFMLPATPDAVFGINPVLGVVLLVPGLVLLGPAMRRAG